MSCSAAADVRVPGVYPAWANWRVQTTLAIRRINNLWKFNVAFSSSPRKTNLCHQDSHGTHKLQKLCDGSPFILYAASPGSTEGVRADSSRPTESFWRVMIFVRQSTCGALATVFITAGSLHEVRQSCPASNLLPLRVPSSCRVPNEHLQAILSSAAR